ncbi:TetR/AcrR family transcriptional regulator, partial [Escherichia coli]
VLTAIIGAADALSTAAGNGILARNVAEDMLSGAMSGVLDTYANSTK